MNYTHTKINKRKLKVMYLCLQHYQYEPKPGRFYRKIVCDMSKKIKHPSWGYDIVPVYDPDTLIYVGHPEPRYLYSSVEELKQRLLSVLQAEIERHQRYITFLENETAFIKETENKLVCLDTEGYDYNRMKRSMHDIGNPSGLYYHYDFCLEYEHQHNKWLKTQKTQKYGPNEKDHKNSLQNDMLEYV